MNAMLQPLTRLGARMHLQILYLLCVIVSQFSISQKCHAQFSTTRYDPISGFYRTGTQQ